MPTPPPSTSMEESRERRKVGLAPLETVTAPSRLGLTLMGMVTMLVGLGIWLLFWFGAAQPPTGLRKWGSALFAGLFFLFGLRFAVEGVRLPRRWRLRRFRGGTEPWGEGYRWARTMDPLPVPPTDWVKGCVGGLALLAFVVAINMVWLDLGAVRGSRLLAYGLIPLATAVIVLVLVSGLWQGVKSIRFGRARLRLVDYPAAPGGPLRAVLTTTNRLPAEGIVEATLARLEETPQAGEAPGRCTPTVEIVHSFRRRSDISTCSDGGHEVSLAFDLPPDIPPTLLHGPDGSRRYWVLEVAVPGRRSFHRRGWSFLVPVYPC
jgi:hypothetical protein